MWRTPIWIGSCVLLGMLACQSPADTGKQAKPKPQAAAKTAPAKVEPPAKAEPPPPAVEPPPVEPPPVEPTPTDAPPTDAPPTEPAPTEPAPTDPNETWKPPPGADIRSDAVIPPGTPTANAEAFKALPSAKADGPPVAGIGPNGIHFDQMVVGRGWEKSRCVEATNTFKLGVDDRANICLRVVHPKDAEEVLTVEWSKEGSPKATRRSNVTVKAMHAYLTRSYLPLRSGMEGNWTATIQTADGYVLGKVAFTVE